MVECYCLRKSKCSKKNLSHCHIVYHKSLCLKTDIRRARPANNCLTYEKAQGERGKEDERENVRERRIQSPHSRVDDMQRLNYTL
jgi:hypothetical protein